jgi:omega-6 fatty acid desaturase (delta-12 desaturase)
MSNQSFQLEAEIKQALAEWPAMLRKYTKSNPRKAILQMLTSYLPFIGLWIAMYYSLQVSYWLTLGLAVANAFFLVRIFIIQHDCGHKSFFQSKKWNNFIGYVCSFFSTIPFSYWARVHDFHHGHCGQLETRDIGDINTLTTDEYKALSPFGRLRYRIFRLPLVTFVIGPAIYMLVNNRLPLVQMKGWKKVYWSQLWNNLGILLAVVLLCWWIGFKKFMLVHVPIIAFFSIIALWFFYVQHQHEHNYKSWKGNWDYLVAAIKGSSFYKLPKVFHWLTGNIGYHHIHHLQPGIPSYNLQACFKENNLINKYVTQVTFWKSLSFMRHKLWDEGEQRMISFREFRMREAIR